MSIGARWGRRIKEDAACALTLDSIHHIFEGTLAEENLNFALREMHKDYLTPAERVKMDRNGWLLATYCRAEYAEAAKPGALDRMIYKYEGTQP